MRLSLGPVCAACLLAAVLAGCGNGDSGDEARDPGPTGSTASSTPTGDTPSDGAVDYELVTMVTQTEAGGQVSQVGVPLAAGDDVQAFTAQFESDSMKARVADEVAKTDVPDGMLLYGAVVAVGCDAPTAVNVSVEGAEVMITAQKVPSPLQECFAAMTTVALVLVPASAVG